MMDFGIFLSIKPNFVRIIESGKKNYEFRKYKPKKDFNKIYVYESHPTCMLKYIIYIDKIVEYPNKIDEFGIGNNDFNNGLKKSKYAYHILHLDMLEEPITLKYLKTMFNFYPPQSFIYENSNYELKKYIDKLKKVRIF